MQSDFDQIVERAGTGSVKWDLYRDRDVIPMWVADMDFRAPEPVLRALRERIEHGVFGYSRASQTLVDLVVERLARLHRWEIEPQWIVWLPGVVPGLNIAGRAVGDPGDEVITTVPAYYPFLEAPGNAARQLVTAPLCQREGRWTFDFERFEEALTERTRLFILCNPYNPVGRVLTREELERIAEICLRRQVVICSDEIHAELVLEPACRHVPTATLDPEVARSTITLIAPSKTFNLPGLNCALAIVPDPELRAAYKRAAEGIVPHVNILGFSAAEAAYRDCEGWRQELLQYLRGNRDYLESEVAATPGLAMSHVEATYLAWIDTRPLELPDPGSFFERAGVGLSDGARFGARGFVRLNFGCRRTLLEEGVARIQAALRAREG